MTLILVVEDNKKIRRNTMFQLEDAGYETVGVPSAEEALVYLEKDGLPDMLLLDVRLEGMSGVDLAVALSQQRRLPPTIILSGEASISETVDALKLGVYDFLEKPATQERLVHSVRNCLETAKLKKHIALLERKMPQGPRILGTSQVMTRLREQIDLAAPTQGRILVRGESGSGKELVAAYIHHLSNRCDKPFVKINCAAIPDHLIESELFGHVRGAFTDARTDKPGLFEQAHGGTLFLDEIGDMEYSLQSRLLRVLEDGTVRRIGDTRDRAVDVRVVAATHCDLEEMVGVKLFRQDLYFRLSAVPLEVPSLRERLDDIPLLFSHFVEQACTLHQLPKRSVSSSVFKALQSYSWPGNIRELRNIAERMVIFGRDPLTVDQIPASLSMTSSASVGLLNPARLTPFAPLREFKQQCEKEYLEMVLHHTNWNVSEAARILGVQRPHLHQKLNQLAVARPHC